MKKLLEYCERLLTVADKAAEKTDDPIKVNLNMGAVLAYSTVIAEIRRRMRDEDSGGD